MALEAVSAAVGAVQFAHHWCIRDLLVPPAIAGFTGAVMPPLRSVKNLVTRRIGQHPPPPVVALQVSQDLEHLPMISR
jgi:hypothetical protein